MAKALHHGRKSRRFPNSSRTSRFALRRCCNRSGIKSTTPSDLGTRVHSDIKSTTRSDLGTTFTAATTEQASPSSSLLPISNKNTAASNTTTSTYETQRLAIASLYKFKYYGISSLKLTGKGSICASITKAIGCHPAVTIKVVKKTKEMLDNKTNSENVAVTTYLCPRERSVRPGSLYGAYAVCIQDQAQYACYC